MPAWKKALLAAYYYGTTPYRALVHHRQRRAGRVPVVILNYHRVADDAPNPWTTPTRAFSRQIDWLSRHFELVSLAEVQSRLRSGHNTRPCASITFDDGYADNCRFAIPRLVKSKIPFTYFVATDAVMHGRAFAHDLAMGRRILPNTIDQLKSLAAVGVEIGAHTRTHADLGSRINPTLLHDEVVAAGEELQTALEHPVRYFAFPFGQHRHLSADVFHLAYDAGYEGVCSAYGGYNIPGDDAFHLQRCCVDGPTLRVKNWARYDPLRGPRIPRFTYNEPPAPTSRLSESQPQDTP